MYPLKNDLFKSLVFAVTLGSVVLHNSNIAEHFSAFLDITSTFTKFQECGFAIRQHKYCCDKHFRQIMPVAYKSQTYM